jgi:hypothetical protein
VRLRIDAGAGVGQASWIGTGGEFLTTLHGGHVAFHGADGAERARTAGTFLPQDPIRAFEEEVAIVVADRVEVRGVDGALRRTLALEPGTQPIGYHGSPAGLAVLLVSAGAVDMTCRCLDADGSERWRAPLSGVGNRSAAVSRDGTRVAFNASGGLSLRDAEGAEVAHLGIGGRVSHFAFDRASARIVGGSTDGTVRVWDRDGRRLFDLPDQGGATFVGFSDDGRRIGTATATMARLYTTDVDELEALAARRSTRRFTDVERARFREILGPPR